MRIKTRDEIRLEEHKRASAARSLEAAISIGAGLFKKTGSDEDAEALAVVVGAYEEVTGPNIAAVKILAHPDAAHTAHVRALAFKSLDFLDG